LIETSRAEGVIPIIYSLTGDADGQVLNVNADEVARALAIQTGASKVVYMTSTGGLLDGDGSVIPVVNITGDYERLMDKRWIQGGMLLKLREIRSLLDAMGDNGSVAITSPEHLVGELFTYRGKGTLIRKGLPIQVHDSIATLDTDRLGALISHSFKRPLNASYFETTPFDTILIAGDYTAAAILTSDGPVPYLDKFVVTREAQGLGLAGSLWNRVIDIRPSLCWRSSASNAINPWYTLRADGMQRLDDWIVFWTGLHDPSLVMRAVRFAASKNISLEPVATKPEEIGVGG
ncbi:MAG: hypothetical protein ACF8GE_07600, partial [Phycisphaerales bacterium JB043]